MKERLAMLNIEMSNAARLISLNSSSGNYQLKTFLSATESVMIDEMGESMDDVDDFPDCDQAQELQHVYTGW
jgi:hypothetical protein